MAPLDLSVLPEANLQGHDQRKPLLSGLLLPLANGNRQQEIREWKEGEVGVLSPPNPSL